MEVSVITVTLNNLLGLQQTRASVALQNPLPEHIIVDGGSVDSTREWLEDLGKNDNVAWSSEPDLGIYDAMNKGAARARGDLLIFLNAGDCLSDGHVLSRVAESGDFLWAVGASRMLDLDGQLLRVHHNLPFRKWKFLLGAKSLPHQATLMKRTFFFDLGGYDLKWGLVADQELLYRALQVTPPKDLHLIISDCDAHGVSSVADPTEFVDVMRSIRDCHGRGPSRLGEAGAVVTKAALRAYFSIRRICSSRR